MYKIQVEYQHAKVTIQTEIVKPTREECVAQADEFLAGSTATGYQIISEGAVNE